MRRAASIGAFVAGMWVAVGMLAVLMLARHPSLRASVTELARQDVAAFVNDRH